MYSEDDTMSISEMQYKKGYDVGYKYGLNNRKAETVKGDQYYVEGYFDGFEDANDEVLLEE